MTRTMRLSGRVVLVTGAARGIGEHTARAAAARGARVALVGLEPDRLERLAVELGPQHVWVECDVTSSRSLESAAAFVVAELGGIDVVVANAGIANHGTVAVTPADAMARVVDVNLTGVMRTVAATLPHVTERRGHFLLVASAAAFTILPGLSVYAATKAGVEQFGNGLRLEVAHRGVTVTTAHPIWVDTDMVRSARRDLPLFGTMLRRLPGQLGSTTSVEECAEAFVSAIERRRRRVYVPRSIGVVQALRSLVLSPLGDAVLRPSASRHVPQLEREVLATGRVFGEHSVAVREP